MLKQNKKLNFIILFAIVVLIFFLVTIFLQDDNKISPENITTELVIQEFISPTGEYTAFFEIHEKYKTINLENNSTKESRVIDTDNINVDFCCFLWTDDGVRFYFAKYNSNFTQPNEFFYIDVNSYDPYALGGISYEDPENIFKGKVIISKAEDNLLYLKIENQTYILDFSKGVGSKPVPL